LNHNNFNIGRESVILMKQEWHNVLNLIGFTLAVLGFAALVEAEHPFMYLYMNVAAGVFVIVALCDIIQIWRK